jgi:hypothetical protein
MSKERILAALDEIRNYVEHHCGEDTAVVQNALQNQTLQNKNQTITNQQPCPGSWNEFQKWYKETHNDEFKNIPYRNIQRIISKAYRSKACGRTIEKTLRVKRPRTRKIKTTIPMPKPKINVNTPIQLQTQDRQFNLGNSFEQKIKTLLQHQEATQKKIANISSAENIKANLQNQENVLKNLHNSYMKDKQEHFSPNTYDMYQKIYMRTLGQVEAQKNKINEQLQKLKKVQINSTTSNVVSSNKHANPIQWNGPVEPNGTRKARINGKKYYYWENEAGQHLRDRDNHNNPGNQFGFYNEDTPGFFRPT